MRRRPDAPSLVAGVTLVAFGAVLVLGASDTIDLDFSAVLPIACAAVGAILLSLGLSRNP